MPELLAEPSPVVEEPGAACAGAPKARPRPRARPVAVETQVADGKRKRAPNLPKLKEGECPRCRMLALVGDRRGGAPHLVSCPYSQKRRALRGE